MLVIPQAILSGAIFNTILHLEKLKLKEIKWLAYNYILHEW
jgi:hypothetical protein